MMRCYGLVLVLSVVVTAGCGDSTKTTTTTPPTRSTPGGNSEITWADVLADTQRLAPLVEAKKTDEILAITAKLEKSGNELLAKLEAELPGTKGSEVVTVAGEREKEKPQKDPKEMTKAEACREFPQRTKELAEATRGQNWERATVIRERVHALADRCNSADTKSKGKQ